MDAVYKEGPHGARIALVGEAPGADEVAQGRPFVGRSGRLLDQTMARVGILRPYCYLDNVFQRRPPDNDAAIWISTNNRGDVTTSDFWKESQAALVERLCDVHPNIIVALGNIPMYTLVEKWGITKRRGSIYWSEAVGAKVICCLHPSAALRQYLYTYLLTFDLMRAKAHSSTPLYTPLERNLLLNPSREEVFSFLERCKGALSVGVDIEVSREEVSHIAFALSPTEAICIPFYQKGHDYWDPPTETAIWQEIAVVLEDARIEKITQNGTFDVTFLFRRFGIRTCPVHDTMIGQGILWPDFPKGLDFITSLYCNGEPYYKDDGKKWIKNPFGADELAFQRYNAMDAAVLMEAWPIIAADLERAGNAEAYEEQRALIEPLVFIGEHGLHIDHGKREALSAANEEEIKTKEAELAALCGTPLNYNSPKQVKEYFYITKGAKPYTKDGKITTDDKALKRLASKGYREAQLILDLRHARKMQGTYYEMVFDADGRLRCSYNPIGTKSGRISSSKTIFGTGGNLQNQPPEMQACMGPDEGYLAISMDLGQAENRVVAFVARETRMIQAFEQGLDIHRYTAAMLHNIPYESVTNEQRQDGKKANHGLNYDLGYLSFAMHYQLENARAKQIVEAYHQIYPRVREWHAQVRAALGKDRTISNCFGRKRVFRDRWEDALFKEAYSFCPQSTVAAKTNRDGVCFLYYSSDPLLKRAMLLNTVHDSIKFQVPITMSPEDITEIILRLKAQLETPIQWQDLSFSIPVDTKIGFTLGEEDMMGLKAPLVNKIGREGVVEKVRELLGGR